ncbi:hypothetical protein EVAR_96079_1 [Eumeta japonica]|uniref:Uncharacterized protein n=1 Tax=Eumeta variegata TaxID=151549 RepID=A0A4C1VFS6_EUMVA|nr:hypothetical protein EVAR_96079_1 [Eumeta japonica]
MSECGAKEIVLSGCRRTTEMSIGERRRGRSGRRTHICNDQRVRAARPGLYRRRAVLSPLICKRKQTATIPADLKTKCSSESYIRYRKLIGYHSGDGEAESVIL